MAEQKRGFLITFEGGEGAGKTLQIEKLMENLRLMKVEFVFVREPGGTPAGEDIRKILKAPEDNLCDKTELFLFMAARAQIVQDVIEPALAAGKVVICDRFIDSSVAYQAYGRLLDKMFVEKANKFATNGLKPDLTFFLDVEPLAGLERAWKSRDGQSDRIEDSKIEFHERLHNGYKEIAASEPNRVKVIDTNEPVDWDEKQKQIVDMVSFLLAIDAA